MTIRLLMSFFVSLFLMGSPHSQVEIKTKTIKVELEVGADKLFELDFVPNTAVDVVNPKVAAITLIPQRKEISLKALSQGRTNIRLRDKSGHSKLVFELVSK